jgi:hypothetical protein
MHLQLFRGLETALFFGLVAMSENGGSCTDASTNWCMLPRKPAASGGRHAFLAEGESENPVLWRTWCNFAFGAFSSNAQRLLQWMAVWGTGRAGGMGLMALGPKRMCRGGGSL